MARSAPVVALLALGCSSRPSAEVRAFAAHTEAPIAAGVGLADLAVDRTTLSEVLERYGAGRPALLFGDDTAIELNYLGGELALLFVLTGDCEAQSRRVGLRSTFSEVGLPGVLEKFPACRALPLTSLAVTAPRRGEPFFRGRSGRGFRLGATLEEVKASLPLLGPRSGRRHAEGLLDEALVCRETQDGLAVCFPDPAGPGPTAGEVRSGRALSAERRKELEEQARKARENVTIRRLAVLAPEPQPEEPEDDDEPTPFEPPDHDEPPDLDEPEDP